MSRIALFRHLSLIVPCAAAIFLAASVPAPGDDGSGPAPVIRGCEERGAPVTPVIYDGDLRDLPPPAPWEPGDPIREIPQRFYPEPGSFIPEKSQRGIDPLAKLQGGATRSPDASFIVPTRNFPGQVFNGAVPFDPNGDAGPTYYIQAINHPSGSTIAVYDKAEPVPNLVANFMMDSLGSGNCANGGGDPIVLYDRFAGRWVLMEFGRGLTPTLCMHVSQSGDPVSGGWYSYDFSLPVFPDYPKVAAWPTDANSGEGSYIVTTNEDTPGIYAMPRGAMLSGAAAGWQRFTVPELWEHGVQALTPADPDGPTEPAAGEPAIVMRHRDTERFGGPPASGDWLEMWEFDVDWITPANSTLAEAPGIEVADFNSELPRPSTGIFPQPGTTIRLDSLHDIIMWRLQYYNHGTRETLMGNFTVDVDGNEHGGVRWFELERSGGGAWSLAQEGTYAPDEANRWMAGSSLDRLGNIAVAYSVSSETIYPSLRYTGRQYDATPGYMLQPESEIHEGTASHLSVRWGDYSAMALDPDDDCTFWFTGMDTTAAVGRTQIASFRFSTCDCALFPLPPAASAAAAGDNSIDLMWDDSELASVVEYEIGRSRTPGGPYETVAVVSDSSPGFGGGSGYIYEDDGVSGGVAYHYTVIADDGSACRSAATNETSATTTGACWLGPEFAGLESTSSPPTADCTIDLEWDAATSVCGGGVSYDVYRSSRSDFTPAPGNLIATGVSGTTYSDPNGLIPDVTYHYIVRAVDNGNGSDDGNVSRLSAVPQGPWTPYTWTDDAGDTGSATLTGGSPWHVDGTEGHYGPQVYMTGAYVNWTCSGLATPILHLGSGSILTFWTKYDIHRTADKGEVQISSDGGANWDRVEMDYPSSVPTSDDNCDLPAGTYFSSTNLTWTEFSADLSPWSGEEVIIRFLLAADDSVTAQGWWIDDISVTNAVEQGVCTMGSSCPDNPFVDVQPDGSLAACAVAPPTLTAALTGGTGPFTYQWYRNGMVLPGETSATYQPSDPGTAYYGAKVRAAGCPDEALDTYDTEVTLADGPLFEGVMSVSSTIEPVCSLEVGWNAANAVCGGPVEYFVYRDDAPGVAAVQQNLVASGLTGTSWIDAGGLVEGDTYYYHVRALDLTTMQFDTNSVEVFADSVGPYSGLYPMLYEDFEDPDSFDDWTVSTGPGPHTCGEWERTDSSTERPWYGAGFYAMAKSQGCAPVLPLTSTSLDSPVIDLDFPGIASVTLKYDINYGHRDGDDATVEVWDGSKWEVVWSDANESINEQHSFDVTGKAAGNPSFQVRFNYQNANDDLWFAVDNVAVIVDAYNSCTTAVGPPPAPDGSGGTEPLRVALTDPSGESMEISWDSASCTAGDYNLLYGDLASVSDYLLGGSLCSIGTAGSYAWSAVPPGDLYFLVVGHDGAGTESSWGMDSLPAERNGPAPSGQCAVVEKDISTHCP